MEYNTSSQLLEENKILGPTVTWIYLSIRTLQGLIAVVANLITIIVVYKYENLWENSTSRLVASLALADFFGGLGPFCALFRNIRLRTFSTTKIQDLICGLNIFVNLVASIGNAYNTLVITIDRYIYIIRPMKYFSIVTKDRVMAAVVIMWTVIILESVLLLVLGPDASVKVPCTMIAVVGKVGYLSLILQLIPVTFFIIVPLYVK